MYFAIHKLGKMLNDSRPTCTPNGDYIPPLTELSKGSQDLLDNEIKVLTQRCSKYLDQCGIKPNKPLWHYDRKNPETHASSPEFKYRHLLEQSV